jgi:vacuolar-type H+-ATPase subunit E/Vma4
MPLEGLEKRILADASSRAEAIRADAKKQAEKIIAEAEAQAKKIEADAEKKARDEAARQEAEQMEGLELRGRSMLLEARNRAMERALAKLKKLVARRIKKKGYGRLISMAIEEAEKVAPQEELTLVIGKNEARMVRNFAGRIKYGKAGNGFELRNRDGSVRLDVTIDGLFEKNRQDIETLLLRAAFANRSGAAKRGRRGG